MGRDELFGVSSGVALGSGGLPARGFGHQHKAF
jgi:hypothetical protein